MAGHNRQHQTPERPETPYLDAAEAGAIFRRSARTMRRLAGRGALPFVQLPGSRAILFRREALDEIARQFEVPSLTEILQSGLAVGIRKDDHA